MDCRIEAFGYVTKIEKLNTIEHNVVSNSFVLHTIEPFPGYYERTMPDVLAPRSMFIITEKQYSKEFIIRVSQKVKEQVSFPCSFTYAELSFNNNYYIAIRVALLQQYQNLEEIQELFIKEGLEFKKRRKVQTSAIIKIYRTFNVQEWIDGIYKDLEFPICYLSIPHPLEWAYFEEITSRVKNNITNRSFDAALGLMYRKPGVMDMIRIYDEKIDEERAELLRNKYLNELNK